MIQPVVQPSPCRCESTDLEVGYAALVNSSVRWVATQPRRAMRRGSLWGRTTRGIVAWRCRTCGRLQLFAPGD